jgi:hypothetical protein
MLFEQTMWRGLVTRLVRLGVPPYFAMQIAAACYPNGAKKAMQGTGFVFAPPIVSPQQAALTVSRFEAVGPRGAPELFVPILVALFGQKRCDQWREELLQADAEAAADAKGQHLEAQFEAALRELGLPPTASLEDVQKQYRSLCRQFHPDRNQREPEEIQAKCDRKMASINKAYEVAVASLEIAKTVPVGRRPSKSARNAEAATGAGPTPATTPGPQQTAPSSSSPSEPKKSTPLGGLRTTVLAGVFVVGGVWLLASMQTIIQPPRHWVNQGALSEASLTSLERQAKSLATRVRAAEEEVRDAGQHAARLNAERTAAMQAEANLGEELKRLGEEVPRLEIDLKACAAAEEKAKMAYRKSYARFREYCDRKDPVSDLEKEHVFLALLLRQGVQLTPSQRVAWEYADKEVQQGILKYLSNRERLHADVRARADEVAQLAAEHRSLTNGLQASRKRRADGPQELSRIKKILAQIPASDLAAAESVLAQKVLAYDRLKAQLVDVESKLNVEMAAAQK